MAPTLQVGSTHAQSGLEPVRNVATLPISRSPHIRELLRFAYLPRDARKELLKIHVWEHKSDQLVRRFGKDRVITIIHPMTLSSGPESGLVNQIFALAGVTAFAALFGALLVLPDFASHDHDGTQLAFATLFESGAFTTAIRPHVTAITREDYQRLRTASDNARRRLHGDNTSIVSVLQGDELLGWRVYKSMQRLLASENVTAAEASRLRSIEVSTYRGLELAPAVQRRVEQAAQMLFSPARRGVVTARRSMRWPTSGSGSSARRFDLVMPSAPVEETGRLEYGCVHARIEADMIRSQAYNKAGRPPVLSDYLPRSPPDAMRSTQVIFVAVGTDISADDARRLEMPAPWGARLALTRREGKSRVEGTGDAATDAATSYTRDALVDLALCRGASWFAGWPGSTFARLVGALHTLDRGRGYHAVCPGSLSFVTPDHRTLMGQHDFCPKLKRDPEK